MTTQTILRESVTEPPVKRGNRWRVIVARPGKGSSGTYSAEVFRRDAHKIVPSGAQSYINHDPDRNPKDMIGFYPEAARWDEDAQAVVAEMEVFSHWEGFVSEVGPHCGISLYALGEIDEDGNVLSFMEDKFNGADLVARPGLEGSGLAEKLYEAAKQASVNKPGVEPSAQEGKDTEMDEKVLEAIAALQTDISALKSAQTAKAEENAQAEADEVAVKEAVAEYAAKVEAIEAARESLLPSQVKHLMAEAKDGREVAPLIETYKAQVVEAKEVLTAQESGAGRLMGGAAPSEVVFNGFGGKK